MFIAVVGIKASDCSCSFLMFFAEREVPAVIKDYFEISLRRSSFFPRDDLGWRFPDVPLDRNAHAWKLSLALPGIWAVRRMLSWRELGKGIKVESSRPVSALYVMVTVTMTLRLTLTVTVTVTVRVTVAVRVRVRVVALGLPGVKQRPPGRAIRARLDLEQPGVQGGCWAVCFRRPD